MTRKPKARADGEGSIYQRASDNLWFATTRHEGKTKRFSATLRKDAISKRDAWLKNREAGLNLKADQWLVGDWLDYWLERKTPRYDAAGNRTDGIEPITLEKYESRIRLYIKPHIGKLRLTIKDVSPERIERWQKALHDQGASAEIRRQTLLVVSAALDVAVKRRMLPYNPASKEQIDRPRVATPKHVQPAEEDLTNLLRAIDRDPLKLLVWLGLGTGLRRAEVAGLRWEDVTYPTADTALVRVHQRVNRLSRRTADRLGMSTSRLERQGLKSQDERRVPVAGLVRGMLDQRWTDQVAQRLARGPAWRGADYQAGQRTGFIFTTSVGTPIEPDTISKYFSSVSKKAGLDIKRFHALRRNFTTLLGHAGVADRVIMELAGHRDRAMTDYYHDPLESDKRDAAQKLDVVLRRLVGGSGD